METFLLEKIERLRTKMVEEASERGNLKDEQVIELSQKLDRYIVFYQKLNRKKIKQSKRSGAFATVYF